MSPSESNKHNKEFVEISLQDLKEKTSQEEQKPPPTKTGSRQFGCARFSRRQRTRWHRFFYKLGCFVHQHYVVFFVLGVALLAISLVGLKSMQVEQEIQNMWVESGGQLEQELAYTSSQLGEEDYGAEMQVVMQVLKEDQNDLHAALLDHLAVMEKVKRLTINMFYHEWSLEDFCFKYEMPFEPSYDVYKEMKKLTPCIVITPLDCFWEGAFLATPTQNGDDSSEFHWSRNSPRQLLEKINTLYQDSYSGWRTDYNMAVKFMNKSGINNGYIDKPCLNPKDKRCPTKYMKLDPQKTLSKGCRGLAENYMHWNKDIIVSTKGQNTQNRINALQSIVQLRSAQSFYQGAILDKLDDQNLRVKINAIEGGFTPQRAQQILNAWKLEFTKLVNEDKNDKDDDSNKQTSGSQFLAFSTSSFQQLVNEMTTVNKRDLAIAGLILGAYAAVSFKRWSRSVFSYGGVGLIGVALGCVSVASGLGISSFCKMKLSAASAQVLPFLALGLGMDSMFLLVRTYMYVCDHGVQDKKIVPTCLGECGLSISIASIATIVGLLSTTIIPIATLQHFAYQAAFMMAIFWLVELFLMPAILSIDIERQKTNRYDLCCCFSQLDTDDDDFTPPVQPQQLVAKRQNNEFSSPKSNHQAFVIGGQKSPASVAQQKSHRQLNVKSNQCGDEESAQQNGEACKDEKRQSLETWLRKFSLSYFAQNYFGEWIINTQMRVLILFMCCTLLFLAGYGTAKVEQGFDLSHMVPHGSPQFDYLQARSRFFSFYQVHVITKKKLNEKTFDYTRNQKAMKEFYREIAQIPNVIKENENERESFWLSIYTRWIKDAEGIFLKEWGEGLIDHQCVPSCNNASEESRIVYRILSTGFSPDADPPKNFSVEVIVRNDEIRREYFYYGLSFWYYYDPLGAYKSQIAIRPEPRMPGLSGTKTINEECKAKPEFMAIPIQVNNLQTTKDYVNLIKDFRSVSDKYADAFGLPSYPLGEPFTQWQQFVSLKRYLLIALVVTLVTVGVVVGGSFMSIKAAFILVFVLGMVFFELYGFIGVLGVKLNALSVVVLVMGVGMGVSNTAHTIMAFLNTPGERSERVRGALEVTLSSIIDNLLSSLIMLALLWTTQFDFVFKYFFQLILCLQCIIFINAVFVLPVILSFFGPCPEVQNRCIRPTLTPTYHIPISIQINTHHHNAPITAPNRRAPPRRLLTPIQEMSERASTADTTTSIRPLTPFNARYEKHKKTGVERCQVSNSENDFEDDYNENNNNDNTNEYDNENNNDADREELYDDFDENRISSVPREHRSPWMHNPTLLTDDNKNNDLTSENSRRKPNSSGRNFRNVGNNNSRDSARNAKKAASKNSPNNGNSNPMPRVIHVKSTDEKNVTTTTNIQATFSIDITTSHSTSRDNLPSVSS